MNKLILHFETPFWPPGFGFHHLMSQPEGAFPSLMDLSPSLGQPVLMAFTSGRYARYMESQGARATLEAAFDALRSVFGSAVRRKSLLGYRLSNWGQDPFSGGGFTIFPPGADGEAYDALAQPCGPLFFAGEATCRSFPGTVHGAYLSGVRAAQEVINSL